MLLKKRKENFSKTPAELRMCPWDIHTVSLLPEELLTPFTVRYIRATLIAGGAIVTLQRGTEILCLAVMRYASDGLNLDQLITASRHRGHGYAGILLHRLLTVSDKEKAVTAHLNTTLESYPLMKRILSDAGFVPHYRYTAYIADAEDMRKGKGKEVHERLHKMAARVREDGYAFLSFAEADEKLLNDVRYSRTNDFRNRLDPISFFEKPAYIIKEYSYILAKDGKAVAYSILSEREPDIVEFDQLAASEEYRYSGLAVLVAVCSYDKVCSDGKYRKLMWQILEGNNNSADMVDQMLSCEKSCTRLDCFRLPPRVQKDAPAPGSRTGEKTVRYWRSIPSPEEPGNGVQYADGEADEIVRWCLENVEG